MSYLKKNSYILYLKLRTFYANDKESYFPRMIPKIFFNVQFKFQSLTSSFANDMLQLYLGLHVGSNLGMKISAFHKFFFHIASTADSNINDSSKKHIY